MDVDVDRLARAVDDTERDRSDAFERLVRDELGGSYRLASAFLTLARSHERRGYRSLREEP